ncbi:hypothetical protein [Erythrobacter litoralis]|uniref:Uncharacterized protein n=1 Tax=Erythrobacter litoralis (strain HTCC2594) TaxID=314225 RepID=Q2NDY4_ERYLH|nr:hypothetical protein [Erythrobacter litoralis]ABC62107.1 hypothetical protein ELI_00075 [Erythrobacter litoralis HTCC2594]
MLGSLWAILTIIGPLLLIGVIVYAWKKNRDAPDRTIRQAERGAREIYDSEPGDPNSRS